MGNVYVLIHQFGIHTMSAKVETKLPITTPAPSPVPAPARQLQIMTMGIPGLGKTTLGRVLEKLFVGGKYADQDIFGMNAKNYHKAVKEFSANQVVKMLFLAKGNHKFQVRKGTFDVLDTSKKQILVGLYFYHPLDVTPSAVSKETKETKAPGASRAPGATSGKNSNLLALAVERIGKRGHGHACLYPGDNLPDILSGFANELEPPTESEMEKFTDVIRVDATLDKLSMVKYVLNELKSSGLLDGYAVETGEGAILAAVEATSAEEKLLESQMATKAAKVAKAPAKTNDPSKPRPTLFWGLVPSKEDWASILATPQVQAALADARPLPIKAYEIAHATMLFVGGAKAPPPGTVGAKDEKEMFELEGKEFKLVINEVVWDNSAIALALDKNFPCQNPIAHVTVGVAPKIQPFYSNALLAKPPTETKRLAFEPPLVVMGRVKRFL